MKRISYNERTRLRPRSGQKVVPHHLTPHPYTPWLADWTDGALRGQDDCRRGRNCGARVVSHAATPDKPSPPVSCAGPLTSVTSATVYLLRRPFNVCDVIHLSPAPAL
ncbi:hypothetical protein C0Q70_13178 [Pomacea canaliculata]|uniref:Uncharacterized protein n=1 Tax=Pomacea canaliculata TaxID=400727 RepID=A0A2T7NWI1_POMCA|nr:hypothetical protein C0Q70_13178 [Pomacea canaliculata]